MNNSEKYYTTIVQQLADFKKTAHNLPPAVKKKNSALHSIFLMVCSLVDFLLLLIKLTTSHHSVLIYTAPGYCSQKDGKTTDRILGNLHLENRIYINQSKEARVESIDSYKVYNIGGLVKLLSFFVRTPKPSLKNLKAYCLINNFILKRYKGNQVYLICYYDANGISVVFSKYRKQFQLIEVQHGNMINYPPYAYASDLNIADAFYVKNQATITYLKNHLNQNFPDVEYHLLPNPKQNTMAQPGIHLLYASTLEFNGIHPMFMEYLTALTPQENVTVYIRLHPREKHKKEIFLNQTKNILSTIIFDDSLNWLASNTIKNLIIISPWSSVIEDAHDNEYPCIIIDPNGLERFRYLLDDTTLYVCSATQLKEEILRLNYITTQH